MKEIEVRGFFSSADLFNDTLVELENKFGNANVKKRLSLTLGDYINFDIETKIRITNGITSITQKLGHQNDVSRDELEINIESEPERIIGLYKMFEEFTKRSTQDYYSVAIQHENYLFDTEDFEIKLFKQFNENNSFYAFEVEGMTKSETEVINFTGELGLQIAEDYNEENIVRERNKTYNLDLKEISDNKLSELVRKYCSI